MIRSHRSTLFFALLPVLAALLTGAATVQAQSPQQTLNQYVADLQKSPNDYALREKIIKHAQAMKPAPAIPEEARRQYIMGKTLFEDAKNVQDFRDAIEKFRKALLVAPWWPDANRDLGMALQSAQEYAEAIRALKLYIATNPGEELSRRAQNEIYKIEARQEKAAKESSPAAVAAKKQQTYEEWLRSLDGARFVGSSNIGNTHFENELIIRGTMLFWRQREVPLGQWYDGGRTQIVGRQAKRLLPGSGIVSDIFTISEDGRSITHVEEAFKGNTYIHYRQ